MDSQMQPPTEALSKEELADRAAEQLDAVTKELRETKRVLLRDWAELAVRERSAYARTVKQLEEQQEELLKVIEANQPD
jgi:nucleoid DNA-binding protein